MEYMAENIKQYQRKWLEHVEWMPPEWLLQQAQFYNPTGRCDKSQPQKRWNNFTGLEIGFFAHSLLQKNENKNSNNNRNKIAIS